MATVSIQAIKTVINGPSETKPNPLRDHMYTFSNSLKQNSSEFQSQVRIKDT